MSRRRTYKLSKSAKNKIDGYIELAKKRKFRKYEKTAEAYA